MTKASSKHSKQASVKPASKGKTGVILINLGTPDGTDYWSMWRYLREFLSDPRVIELPKWKWYPILYGPVLLTRPRTSGNNYKTIWNNELNESPLRTITRAQGEKLAAAFAGSPDVVVDWAMRYGNPSTESVVDRMIKAGVDRLLAVPLYPQYSASTTATANDALFAALMKQRVQPAVRTLPPYYDEPAYIEALANSITSYISTLDFEPERVIASFHGIPVSYSKKGDPYRSHCERTGDLLREKLGWDENRLMTCFQSRFGSEEWLQPYTDKTVERLAKEGVKSIAVINPGFSADCIETLEEIAGEAGEIFLHNGGENFAHIPCLNDSEAGMALIEMLVRRELTGWI